MPPITPTTITVFISAVFLLFVFRFLWLGASWTMNHTASGDFSATGIRTVSGNIEETASPPSIPQAQGGVLTVRTDGTHGTLTMNSSAHGIVTGQRFDLYWQGGQTFNCTAGTVAGTSIPFTCNTTLAAPSAPTTSTTGGGALAATTYYVKVSYVNSLGETLASAETSQAALINTLLTVTSPSALGSGLLAAIGYNVYVSNTAGGGSGAETKQNAAPIAIGLTWTEPTTGLVVGAAPPATTTAGANLPVATTAVVVGIATQLNLNINGSNLLGLFCASPQQGYFVFDVNTLDVFAVSVGAFGVVQNAQNGFQWITGDGNPNPLGTNAVTSVWVSHSYTTGPVTNQGGNQQGAGGGIRVGVLSN